MIVSREGEEIILHKDVYLDHPFSEEEEVDLEPLRFQSEVRFAADQGGNYLTRGLKSTKQVREYLKQKNFEASAIEEALEILTRNGYLNDEEFALSYYERYHTEKGNLWIQAKLRERGVEITLPKERVEDCLRVLEKKALGREISDFQEENKLKNFLLQRGFSFESINQAIKRYKSERTCDKSFT
ncbi:regulatory protein RecX [Guggenheimella bovis]